MKVPLLALCAAPWGTPPALPVGLPVEAPPVLPVKAQPHLRPEGDALGPGGEGMAPAAALPVEVAVPPMLVPPVRAMATNLRTTAATHLRRCRASHTTATRGQSPALRTLFAVSSLSKARSGQCMVWAGTPD